MKRLRSLVARATFGVSLFGGAAAVVLTLASVASASVLGANGRAADGDPGVADLRLEGTVDPAQAAVGDSITWRLTVNDYNTGPALDVWVDVTLPANVSLTSSYTDRGTGCTVDGNNHLHCYLDWLADTVQFGHVILVTKVTATGDHVLSAVTGYRAADPVPANNTLTLTATTPSPPPPPPPPPAPITIVLPVIGPATIVPGPIAGKRVTVSFRVTRGDTGAPLTQGTITGDPSVSGKVIAYAKQFKNGVAQLSFVIPKTAKGKKLRVEVTVEANGGSVTKVATIRVR